LTDDIAQLEPTALWHWFAELNAIPRASGKEQMAADFVRKFSHQLGLENHVDKAGNVIIRKPATAGMEDRVGVVLQGHLDMVHQKNADTDFDFATEGIRMRVDSDWVSAEGTTLGADNGIGVAAILAILAADDIPHPPIEALFTVNEESGMTGATGLASDSLTGSILLNLDTEDDEEFTIGCAGAVNVVATGTFSETAAEPELASFRLSVKGLTGGHSGMDIHRGRGNANKLLNRLLFLGAKQQGLRVAAIDSGGLRNAIPREGAAVVTVDPSRAADLRNFMETQAEILHSEYAVTDPGLEVLLVPVDAPAFLLPKAFQRSLLNGVYACPNGISRMSPEIEGLVLTSNNLAALRVANGQFSISCLVRSAIDSEKLDLVHAIGCALEGLGGRVEASGSYPGWTPRPDAAIVRMMRELYVDLFEQEPKVLACHAGLECGIIGASYPQMEMISFGPNIRGAHSPDEKVQISSVQKFWTLLLAALARMPRAAANRS